MPLAVVVFPGRLEMVHPALPFVCAFTVLRVAYDFDIGTCFCRAVVVSGLHLPHLMLCPLPLFCIEVIFGCACCLPLGFDVYRCAHVAMFVLLILVFRSATRRSCIAPAGL